MESNKRLQADEKRYMLGRLLQSLFYITAG